MSSKVCGVSWDKRRNKWRASASLDGKRTYLGTFHSQAAAALAKDTFVMNSPRTAVGCRIEVFWPEDQEWYGGLVTAHDAASGKHKIRYDDGEVERVALEKEEFRWAAETGGATDSKEHGAENDSKDDNDDGKDREDDDVDTQAQLHHTRAVRQICMETGRELARYPTIVAASRAIGVSRVAVFHAVSGRNASSGGYRWEYVDPTYRAQRPVRQICMETGRELATYPSTSIAAQAFGKSKSSIYHAISGRHASVGGFRWEYADPARRPQCRPVRQICMETGCELAMYPTAAAAAQAIGKSRSAIHHAVSGRNASAGGYRWEFADAIEEEEEKEEEDDDDNDNHAEMEGGPNYSQREGGALPCTEPLGGGPTATTLDDGDPTEEIFEGILGFASAEERAEYITQHDGARPAMKASREEGRAAVGRRIDVFWPEDRKWYGGLVTAYVAASGKHEIRYDDGEIERLTLAQEAFRWGAETGGATDSKEERAEHDSDDDDDDNDENDREDDDDKEVELHNVRPVRQICMETGRELARYPSAAAAAQAIGKSRSAIHHVVSGTNASAGGYRWVYVDPAQRVQRPMRQICMETGRELATYPSARAASRAIGHVNSSRVKKCAGGRSKSAGGYRWAYIDEDEDEVARSAKKASREEGRAAVGRRVEVFWPEDQRWYGGLVTKYVAASGKHKIRYDDGEIERLALAKEEFRWTAETGGATDSKEERAEHDNEDDDGKDRDDDDDNEVEHFNARAVRQICIETGRELARYPTVAAAAQAIGRTRSAVNNVVLGHSASSGGYRWAYIDEDEDEKAARPAKRRRLENGHQRESQYVGVSRRGPSFRFQITVHGKRVQKSFGTEEAAARARDRLVSRESLPERTAYIAHMCAPLADP